MMPPQGTIVCTTNRTFITSGKCAVDIAFAKGTKTVYYLKNAGFFDIENEIVYGTENNSRDYGVYLLQHKWSNEE